PQAGAARERGTACGSRGGGGRGHGSATTGCGGRRDRVGSAERKQYIGRSARSFSTTATDRWRDTPSHSARREGARAPGSPAHRQAQCPGDRKTAVAGTTQTAFRFVRARQGKKVQLSPAGVRLTSVSGVNFDENRMVLYL